MIALDIDGVVANTSPLLIEEAAKIGYNLVFDRYHPSNSENYLSPIVDKILTLRMAEIAPYPDAIEFMDIINKNLGPITFLTARNVKYAESTRIWLNLNFSFSFSLACYASKDKVKFFKENITRAFVEDRLSTANMVAESGLVQVYLINRNWNINRYTHPGVRRINNLGEFYYSECKP